MQQREIIIFAFMLFLTACSGTTLSYQSEITPTDQEILTQEPEEESELRIWISSELPSRLRDSLVIPDTILLSTITEDPNLRIEICNNAQPNGEWVYALAAPFGTLMDNITTDELMDLWHGQASDGLAGYTIMLGIETLQVFTLLWGEHGDLVISAPESGIEWDTRGIAPQILTILPFEDLEPIWKVISIDQVSPLHRGLDTGSYPLIIPYCLIGDAENVARAATNGLLIPESNRNEDSLTVLVMTGVTALVRQTAVQIELDGVTFPGEQIRGTLINADLTHISNEVSFMEGCPRADLNTMQFCAPPDYLGLLSDVGTDIVELTGNHLLDYGPEAFRYTLELYQDEEIETYGGGINLEDSQQPLLIEDHGNRIAFLGCNPTGPESDWATETIAGSAPCDNDLLEEQIQNLTTLGYAVIVTFQHIEACQLEPLSPQRGDFLRASRAGAVIVQGSQAHCPQGFEFEGMNFIHYGLGNLFFDQMDPITSQEFIDRHFFYEGRYISTELITVRLENYAQPHLMTPEERERLLTATFTSSGWLP